jgi:hypothetical protein
MVLWEITNARWLWASKVVALGLRDARENDRGVEHDATLAAPIPKRRETNITEGYPWLNTIDGKMKAQETNSADIRSSSTSTTTNKPIGKNDLIIVLS